MKITNDKKTKSNYFSLIGKIKVRDPKMMIDESMFQMYTMLFMDNITNNQTNDYLINMVEPNIPLNTGNNSKNKMKCMITKGSNINYL